MSISNNKNLIIVENDRGFIPPLKESIQKIIGKLELVFTIEYDLCYSYLSAKKKIWSKAPHTEVDLIIVDSRLPYCDADNEDGDYLGLKLVKEIKHDFPDLKYLPVTSFKEELEMLNPLLYCFDESDIGEVVDKLPVKILAEKIACLLTN